MSFSDHAENAIMLILYNATAWANVCDNASTSPRTQIAWALHTADPGEAGTMATSETNYTSYARAATSRASGAGGMTVTANSVSPQANVQFAAGTGGSGTVTYFSTGHTGGGAANIFMSGTVTPNIAVGSGITPILTTATTLTLD